MSTTHDTKEGAGRREEPESAGTTCPLCALTRALQLEKLVGAETAKHLRRSQKEILLAVRSAINSAIDDLEAKAEPRRAERIAVE